jgi:hypothetical protein
MIKKTLDVCERQNGKDVKIGVVETIHIALTKDIDEFLIDVQEIVELTSIDEFISCYGYGKDVKSRASFKNGLKTGVAPEIKELKQMVKDGLVTKEEIDALIVSKRGAKNV